MIEKKFRSVLRAIGEHLAAMKALPADLAYQALSQIVSRGAMLVTGIIISRKAGIEVFSEVQYYYVTATTFAIYLGLGIGKVAVIYFSTDIDVASLKRRLEMTATMYVTFLTGIAIFLIATAGSRLFLGERISFNSAVFGLLVMALFLQEVLESVLAAQRRFRAIFFINLVPGIGLIGTISILVFSGYGTQALVISLSIAPLICSTMLLMAIVWDQQLRSTIVAFKRFDPAPMGAVIVFSIPMFLMGIMNATAPWFISRVMQHQASPDQLGLFLVSLQWFSIILFLPTILTKVIAPEIVREVEQTGAIAETFRTRVKFIGITATIVSCIVIVLSPAVLWLYGVSGSEYQLRFCTMMASGIFAACILPFANYVLASRQVWKWLLVQTLFTLIVLGVYFGLSYQGLQLPETGFLVGYGLVFCYLVWFDSSSPWRDLKPNSPTFHGISN